MRSPTSIYHLFRPRNEGHAVALSRAGYADGADGTCYELASFPPELRTVEVYRRIVASTPLPKIFCTYRSDTYLGENDEARMASLLRAAEAGADYIDVMGDLYDPSVDQLSFSSAAIEKQKQVISAVHAFGAKVVVSSHVTERTMTADEIVEHLSAEAARGADVCKLVVRMDTVVDLNEAIMALSRLQACFDRPWIFLGSGPFGRLQRFIGPSFGCAVEFAVHDYDPLEGYDQPTICSLRQGIDAVSFAAPVPT